MKDVFNTPFEAALRILIILNATHCYLSVDRIVALDFISIYGKDFGVSEYNLHGNNNYRFSEYTSKREIVSQSIKELVLGGYIKPHCDRNGFNYSISRKGVTFYESLNDEYADCFTDIVKQSMELFSKYSDRELILCINEFAIAMFGGKK